MVRSKRKKHAQKARAAVKTPHKVQKKEGFLIDSEIVATTPSTTKTQRRKSTTYFLPPETHMRRRESRSSGATSRTKNEKYHEYNAVSEGRWRKLFFTLLLATRLGAFDVSYGLICEAAPGARAHPHPATTAGWTEPSSKARCAHCKDKDDEPQSARQSSMRR